MGGHFDLGNFIRDHFASLCAIAFKITGNSEVAKDLAQDVIIKFWENQGQHKQLDSIENYLFIMIRNEALNYLRGLSREKNRHEKASLNSEQEESLWGHHHRTRSQPATSNCHCNSPPTMQPNRRTLPHGQKHERDRRNPRHRREYRESPKKQGHP